MECLAQHHSLILQKKTPQEQSSEVTLFLFLSLNFHARLSLMSGSQSLPTLNLSC